MKPENLGFGINTEHDEIDPFITPDESYIIYLRRGDEGFGGVDLFISFKKEDGSWTEGKNMGPEINSSATEYCPSVSPDGRYIFFASNRSIHKNYSDVPLSFKEKIKILDNPGNGRGDIYWIDAKIIESLKPQKYGLNSKKCKVSYEKIRISFSIDLFSIALINPSVGANSRHIRWSLTQFTFLISLECA